MDLSEGQETLGSINSEAFSESSEVLSEETGSLMTCSSGDCADVDATPDKEGCFVCVRVIM